MDAATATAVSKASEEVITSSGVETSPPVGAAAAASSTPAHTHASDHAPLPAQNGGVNDAIDTWDDQTVVRTKSFQVADRALMAVVLCDGS